MLTNCSFECIIYNMKLCNECDSRALCCDFCAYYQFNGDEQGRYTGDGWCRLHKREEDPASLCDDFFCFQLLTKDGVPGEH
jgi:hypothetical protein